MKNKKRIDELLVERGLAESLPAARALVMAGKVVADDQRVDKPSVLIDSGTAVRVKSESRFVSRAGEKLFGAVSDLGLQARIVGRRFLDIGASTGGFTHCLLELGAAGVVAVDVGSNQLAWSIRGDERVDVHENTDIRDLPRQASEKCEAVVADISFNSLARLAGDIVGAAPRAEFMLLLVKPQFELSRAEIPDGGIVSDDRLREKAVRKVSEAFADLRWKVANQVDAQIAGRSGNREIFLLLEPMN